MLRELQTASYNKRLLHYDDALAHSTKSTRGVLNKYCQGILAYLPFSPLAKSQPYCSKI